MKLELTPKVIQAIRAASNFSATKDVRFHLTGVHIRPFAGKGLRIEATDTHALYVQYIPMNVPEDAIPVIIRGEAVKAMKSKSVVIVTDKNVEIVTNNQTQTFYNIEGENFPDVDRVCQFKNGVFGLPEKFITNQDKKLIDGSRAINVKDMKRIFDAAKELKTICIRPHISSNAYLFAFDKYDAFAMSMAMR